MSMDIEEVKASITNYFQSIRESRNEEDDFYIERNNDGTLCGVPICWSKRSTSLEGNERSSQDIR
jgi:hypothetical protein